MKRWGGWGEETATYPSPDSAAQYLTMLRADEMITLKVLRVLKAAGRL